MTVTALPVVEPGDTREMARQAYRESVAAGTPLTGKELGERHGMGERWGRARIAECRESGTARPAARRRPVRRPVVTTLPLPEDPEPPAQETIIVVPAQDAAQETAQPRLARHVVWAAFILGIAASLAANVAHAKPDLGPRLAAGFVPLALLLAVECMSRPAWRRTGAWWGLARYGGTGLVALVAAVLSYRHMSGLMHTYGEDRFNAGIAPLAVDGLMVVSGFALLAMENPRRSS